MVNIFELLKTIVQPELKSPVPKLLDPRADSTEVPKENPYGGLSLNEGKTSIPASVAPLIAQVAKSYKIHPSVLAALLFQESSFNPNAVNEGVTEKGIPYKDRGIAQINSSSFPQVTDQQAMDPNFAIKFAAKLLANNSKGLGDINKGIASYNVGYNGVAKNLGQNTPFGGGEKGQTYIDNVARNLTPELRKQLNIKTTY